jgi:guanylate kinase
VSQPSVTPQPETIKPGRLFVLSGPSGSGKSTLARRALEDPSVHARLSVSATTRPPRPGERDEVDYFFLPRDEFETRRDEGQFLEWAKVHGHLYGTPAAPVLESLRQGESVLLEIDVQGAAQVVEKVPETVLVFVNVPSWELLESRLRGRRSEDEPAIQRRLEAARREINQAAHYTHHIVNDDLDRAVGQLVAILTQDHPGG